jgi:hypothetical protein
MYPMIASILIWRMSRRWRRITALINGSCVLASSYVPSQTGHAMVSSAEQRHGLSNNEFLTCARCSHLISTLRRQVWGSDIGV